MKRIRSIGLIGALAAMAAFTLPLAADATGPRPTADTPSAPTTDWTIIWYGVADNNLEAYTLDDLRELTQAGFGRSIKVVGLIDRQARDNSDPSGDVSDGPIDGLGDFSGAKAFTIVGGKLRQVKDFGEIDSGDPTVFGSFVASAIKVAPAKHYALMVLDHGAGVGGIGFDDHEGASPAAGMSGADFSNALQRALAPTHTRLDLLDLDACLMSNYEIVTRLAPLTKYLVASEDSEYGQAQDYTSLSALAADPSMDGRALGKVILDAYAADFGVFSDVPSTTFGVIDMDRVPALTRSVENFATALLAAGDVDGFLAAARASRNVISLEPDEAGWGFVDLGDLSNRLAQPGNPDAVRIAADSVTRSLAAVFTATYRGINRDAASEMSIIVPESADGYGAWYLRDGGSRPWAAWLDEIFAPPASTAPQDTTASLWTDDLPTLVSADETSILISGTLDAGQRAGRGIGSVDGIFGVLLDDGSLDALIEYPAVLDAGETDDVQTNWTYQYFSLGDRASTFEPTTYLQFGEDRISGVILGDYDAGYGQRTSAALVFALDNESGAFVGETRLVQLGSAGTSQIFPVDGSSFLATRTVYDQQTGHIRIVTGAIELDTLRLRQVVLDTAASTIGAGLSAIDRNGQDSNIWSGLDL